MLAKEARRQDGRCASLTRLVLARAASKILTASLSASSE